MPKARAELEESIGRGKPMEESDIARLRYLQAVLKETLRLHPAAPFLVPRKAEIDVELGGYIIPKGAQFLVNVWAIERDGSIWKNPEEFLSERFLGSEIDVKGQNFELTPFGAGWRLCPGYPLAMRMLLLVLGSLVNCFDWKLEGGIKSKEMDMDDKFGITLEKAQPVIAVLYSRLMDHGGRINWPWIIFLDISCPTKNIFSALLTKVELFFKKKGTEPHWNPVRVSAYHLQISNF